MWLLGGQCLLRVHWPILATALLWENLPWWWFGFKKPWSEVYIFTAGPLWLVWRVGTTKFGSDGCMLAWFFGPEMSNDIIDTEKVRGGWVQCENKVFVVGGESIGESKDKIFIRHRNSNLSQLKHNSLHICNPGCYPLAILHLHLPKCPLESHMHGEPSQLVNVFQFTLDLWCKPGSHMC